MLAFILTDLAALGVLGGCIYGIKVWWDSTDPKR